MELARQLGDGVDDVLGSVELGVVDQQWFWRSGLLKESNQLVNSGGDISDSELNHDFNETDNWRVCLASLSSVVAELLLWSTKQFS